MSAKYLLIQGRSRQTAMVATCAPSLATSAWYLSQMKPYVLGQGCSPLRRAYPLFSLSLPPLSGQGWLFVASLGQSRLPAPSTGALSVICPSCQSSLRAGSAHISLDVACFFSCKSYSKFALSTQSLCGLIKCCRINQIFLIFANKFTTTVVYFTL